MFKNNDKNVAFQIYTKIATQSRKPFFFKKIKIIDSVEFRLEILFLNLVIILWAMKSNEKLENISQNLLNIFFEDLDNSLRELGVSDLSVGKKIKILAENFYGRLASYSASFENLLIDKNLNKIKDSLEKNFKFSDNKQIKIDELVSYTKRNIMNFKKTKEDSFLNINFNFKNPQY